MQEGLNILIVEDEVLISERLKQIVHSFGHTVVGICNSLDAVQKFDFSLEPDLVLLDIRMNGVNEGVEVAKLIKEKNIPFIFITSFSDKETLQEAILQGPSGYVVKPFSLAEIKNVIANVEKEINGRFLILQSNNRFVKIPFQKIKWINSSNVYVEVHYDGKKHLERMKLSDLEVMLPSDIFIRIHQSYIVNKFFVDKIEGNTIEVEGVSFPVSKKFKTNVESLL
jgi:DNA-binding LytR/AlgR family response regulator